MKATIRMMLYSLAPAALLATLTLNAAQPASADTPIILPVGQGCPGFNLGIEATDGNLHTTNFTDKNGNVVRSITAGKGVVLHFTNYGTDPNNPAAGKAVAIKTGGSVTHTTYNSDGTFTVTGTGHNGLILFPTDMPAGPTTTVYIGKIVYTVNPSTGVFTLLSTSGQARDICAELAG